MRSPTKSSWVSATRRPLNPSPLWGGSAERSGGRGGGSARQCVNNHFAEAAPPPDRPSAGHPPHESPRGGGQSHMEFFYAVRTRTLFVSRDISTGRPCERRDP